MREGASEGSVRLVCVLAEGHQEGEEARNESEEDVQVAILRSCRHSHHQFPKGRKKDKLDSHERFILSTIQNRQNTTCIIKLPMEMSTGPTKALSNVCDCAPKCYRIWLLGKAGERVNRQYKRVVDLQLQDENRMSILWCGLTGHSSRKDKESLEAKHT